jgi:hypothetical protein
MPSSSAAVVALIGVAAIGAACAASIPKGLDPVERARLADAYPVRVVHYAPISRLAVIRLGGGFERASTTYVDLPDPVREVQARFVEGIRGALGEGAVQPVEVEPFSEHIPAVSVEPAKLRELLGPVVAIDLETIAWQMPFVSRSFIDASRTTYGVEFSVRARLLRLSDGRLLWQEFCAVQKGDDPVALGKLAADDWALLQARRLVVAQACADQLVRSFLGRE